MSRTDIMRLRESAMRYAEQLNGPRFNVGEFVTPAAGGTLVGEGAPHIVVELWGAEPDFSRGDIGTHEYGIRPDMRVLSIVNQKIVSAYWVESWMFELWPVS